MILSRSFMEYCIEGWDNFPRKLLMYSTNFAYPLQSYFQTIICNSPLLQNTTIDTDLTYMPSQNPNDVVSPHTLKLPDYMKMVTSNSTAIFARPFEDDDPVLKKIDEHVLNRSADGVVPGQWCSGEAKKTKKEKEEEEESSKNNKDEYLCSGWGSNIDDVKPGIYGKKLRGFLYKLVSDGSGRRINQCQEQNV